MTDFLFFLLVTHSFVNTGWKTEQPVLVNHKIASMSHARHSNHLFKAVRCATNFFYFFFRFPHHFISHPPKTLDALHLLFSGRNTLQPRVTNLTRHLSVESTIYEVVAVTLTWQDDLSFMCT